MNQIVAIIDYGLGNLRSVAGAVEKLGYVPIISNKNEDLKNASKLILPGVGAFGEGMKNLQSLGLIESLNYLVMQQKKPILGICLGAQLFAKESYEFGHHKGLGWIDASVTKLDVSGTNLKLPHIGWNELIQTKKSILLNEIPNNALFYYIHSFHIKPTENSLVVGECLYGDRFVSVLQKDNIYATQFHPEKSQIFGLQLLKNFLEKG